MLREDANRLSRIGVALQLDRGRWIWLLAILAVLVGVLALGDNVGELLRYDRGAIAAGGWWRLLTAHIVHLDAHHLVLNALGLVLLWSLFAADYDAVDGANGRDFSGSAGEEDFVGDVEKLAGDGLLGDSVAEVAGDR